MWQKKFERLKVWEIWSTFAEGRPCGKHELEYGSLSSPPGGDTGPSWQPARKQGAQSYKRKELTWPTTWMPLEANSFPKPWERKSVLLTNWIWFCDTGTGGHSWTTLYLVFWPIYCELTNYRSNRKLQKQC